MSMRTNNITIYDVDEPEFLEEPDGAPKRRLTTPWILSNGRFFRVNLTIVGPVPEQPEDHFSLCYGEMERIRKAVSDIVELLEEKLTREDPVRQ